MKRHVHKPSSTRKKPFVLRDARGTVIRVLSVRKTRAMSMWRLLRNRDDYVGSSFGQ